MPQPPGNKNKKKLLFVDASAWIALHAQDDAHHEDAVRFFSPASLLAGGLVPVTSNFVFDEVYTYFCREHEAAVFIGDSMRSSRILKILRVEAGDEDRAWEIAQKYTDKDLSYTDCTSFALMERLKCQKAFTFDKHFRQMGFEVFP